MTDIAELHALVRDLRRIQAEARPVILAAIRRRNVNMRTEGPTGFVMLPQCAEPKEAPAHD